MTAQKDSDQQTIDHSPASQPQEQPAKAEKKPAARKKAAPKTASSKTATTSSSSRKKASASETPTGAEAAEGTPPEPKKTSSRSGKTAAAPKSVKSSAAKEAAPEQGAEKKPVARKTAAAKTASKTTAARSAGVAAKKSQSKAKAAASEPVADFPAIEPLAGALEEAKSAPEKKAAKPRARGGTAKSATSRAKKSVSALVTEPLPSEEPAVVHAEQEIADAPVEDAALLPAVPDADMLPPVFAETVEDDGEDAVSADAAPETETLEPELAPSAASDDFWSSGGAFAYFGDETHPDAVEEEEDALAGGGEGQVSGVAAGETGERKRRSRSRRGRKKSAEARAESGGAAKAEEDARQESPVEDTQPVETGDEDEGDASAQGVKSGRRKMFVSVLPGEQIEVVITEEGQVLEYYVEMLHQVKTKGNIYKATIHNVDPNLQAAFVSYGAVKNGFLQIDEVHPEYYNVPHDPTKGRKYPLIQKVLKAGQEVLVQVVKEPSGTKGAFLTTYLSLPGRFVVLTPGREQIGVSRKVEQEGERSRLRELLEGLSPGPGLGVIVRTVSMGASKSSLQKDLQFLKRLWKEVRARGTSEKAPNLVYQEMDLTTRAVRDYLTDEVAEVWVDDETTAAGITEVATMLFPRKQNLVRVHKDTGTTLFERFNLQRQLDQIHSREVSLPSGGQLVIDATEALTAIDINSGRSGGKNNFEDMAFRTNMEAARMIPLQLRLRDIGGQIVADFIEMRDRGHWREVEKTLRQGMKVDRARYDVGKIGPFGMLEIVRQRLGSSAISISSEPCPYCKGTGVRRNLEWRSQQALREIQKELRVAQSQNKVEHTYAAEPALALHLLNNKRQRLLEMEQSFGIRLEIRFKQQDL